MVTTPIVFQTCPKCRRHTLYEQRPPTGKQVGIDDVPKAKMRVCRSPKCGYRELIE